MTKEHAISAAQVEADLHDCTLVVTFNPYGEDTEDENFGFMPEGALKIFKYETRVATILPTKD